MSRKSIAYECVTDAKWGFHKLLDKYIYEVRENVTHIRYSKNVRKRCKSTAKVSQYATVILLAEKTR